METNPVLVSIGIPTYQRSEGLKKTLTNITNQTYPHLEIIVSDNGSSGNDTEEVIREFMSKDARIKYFRQPENYGPTYNFQFVLENSNGEYFMWVADDDWRDSRFVSALLTKIVGQSDVAIAFSNIRVLDEAGNSHPDYKNYSTIFQAFTTNNRWLRLWRYYMQDERLGKANIIYGMMRRRDLIGFDWQKFTQRYGTFGVDMLFVYRLLALGRLALESSVLCGSTVGNVKHYNQEVTSSNSKLIVFLSKQTPWIRNYIYYIGVSPNAYKILPIIGLPLKLAKLFINDMPRLKSFLRACLGSYRQLKQRGAALLINTFGAKSQTKESYSQCGEDIIIDFIFAWLGRENISYLDVGTNDPIHLNNTYLFYKKNGRGVLVEPDPRLYKEIKKSRPNDICINAGVGTGNDDSLTFFLMSPDTLSTSSPEQAKQYMSLGVELKEEFKVPLININHIIEKHFNFAAPDYLSIDVEGSDFEIIKSLDLKLYRPTVICAETLTYTNNNSEKKIEEISKYLSENNYFIYADTYINTIFVDKFVWNARPTS